LTVNYGSSWETAWTSYINFLKLFRESHLHQSFSAGFEPQFRHGIEARVGLFPYHWYTECIGGDCTMDPPENETEAVLLALEYVRSGYPSPLVTENKRVNESSPSSERVCDLYLAPSKIPGLGRGVVAGRTFQENETVEINPTLSISRNAADDLSAVLRLCSSNTDSQDVVMLGPAVFYNHHPDYNAEFLWESWPIIPMPVPSEAFAEHTAITHYATRPVSAGEEVFILYSDSFETDINATYSTSSSVPKYTKTELQEVGHCLSDVYVNKSVLPKAGQGLFAKIPFKTGDVVTISPVAVLPKHAVEATSTESVLLNFCIVSEGSDVALFPFGLAGMVNHGGVDSNLRMEWYGWGGDNTSVSEMLARSADDLTAMSSAPLDVAYIATRDIAAGEELTVNYGSSWEKSFAMYLEDLRTWLHVRKSQPYIILPNIFKPSFRHGVAAPERFFPDHWSQKSVVEQDTPVD